jgi:hypothetical protein
MWDVTYELARRELRQAEEMGEATDWKGYIPVGGELLPPDAEEEADDADALGGVGQVELPAFSVNQPVNGG